MALAVARSIDPTIPLPFQFPDFQMTHFPYPAGCFHARSRERLANKGEEVNLRPERPTHCRDAKLNIPKLSFAASKRDRQGVEDGADDMDSSDHLPQSDKR